MVLDQLHHPLLAAETLVVQSACLYKLVTHGVFRVEVCGFRPCLIILARPARLLVLILDELVLNLDGLSQELVSNIKLVFLQIDATEIVHAATKFLLVTQLLENLRDFMVSQQS